MMENRTGESESLRGDAVSRISRCQKRVTRSTSRDAIRKGSGSFHYFDGKGNSQTARKDDGMNRTDDTFALRSLLVTMARHAGVTLDEDTVTRLAPILASVLRDWKALTPRVAPDVEPMSAGRWPVAGDDAD